MRAFIKILVLIMILSSCKRSYYFEESELKWNPYKGNEILIFKSNTGFTDTVRLRGSYKTMYDVSSFGKVSYEIIKVYCNDYKPNQDVLSSKDEFLEMKSGYTESASLFFSLSLKHAELQPQFHLIKNLETIKLSKICINNRTYNDVVTIKGNHEDNKNFFEQSTNQVVFWSIKEGIVRFILEDGSIWDLVKKYSK
ncbi:MAG: hypothetical protein V2A54_09265 [Bacteroidota bacterium]